MVNPATAQSSRPEWDEFSNHLRSIAPVAIRLDGEPPVLLFLDASGNRIGLRVKGTNEGTLISPMAALQIKTVGLHDGEYLEVSTTERHLYRHFFAFALSVADAVQQTGLPPLTALDRAVSDWRALVDQLALLSSERQMGLLGELWLLNRLIDSRGPLALDAWTGPIGEAHDFRVEGVEFEVKTTSGEHRSHIISSNSQLVASPGHDLYLLSLQFASAGAAGLSISDFVTRLRERMQPLSQDELFTLRLNRSFGISEENLHHYSLPMQLRTPPYLVPVGTEFPRITVSDILSLPHREMTRISDVRYRVDVEGLGSEDGTAPFLNVLPLSMK